MTDLSLAADFPPAAREAWLERVAAVLKGASFERLVATTYDGLRIEPLYAKAEPQPQPGRAAAGRWRIAQRLDHPEPPRANELALADLEGGADALVLVQAGAASGRGFGVAIADHDDLDRALAGVMLDVIALRLEPAPFTAAAAATQCQRLAERRRLDPAGLEIDFGFDPLGDAARRGAGPAPLPDLARAAAATARTLQQAGFAGPFLRVDTRPYHEAGAAEAQELAAALATGVAYLRALEAAGLSLDEARRALGFLVAVDADEFLGIAKLRALRRLWAQLEAACGLDPQPIRIGAETAWRMLTRRDPWVNMLRAAVAVFAAGIGGADSVTVLPFTAALGLPDGFARRIARTTQLILMEESNLARVADPAAGSGAFEGLTEALCERAWALFQEIEREGGMAASLAAGAVQARIAATRAARARATATRRDAITGVSAFPALAEAAVAVLMRAPAETQSGAAAAMAGFPALPSIRTAAPFEALRDEAEARAARGGERPRLFLATLGSLAEFTPRAMFAKNLFEAGGIETVGGDGSASLDAMVAAFRQSGARLACLCGTDQAYAAEAAAAAVALRQAGAARIYLAGRPGDRAEALEQAGVSAYVFVGCDALAALREALAAA